MDELIKAIEKLKKDADARCEKTLRKISARDGDITKLYVELSIDTGKYLAYCNVLDIIWKAAEG